MRNSIDVYSEITEEGLYCFAVVNHKTWNVIREKGKGHYLPMQAREAGCEWLKNNSWN